MPKELIQPIETLPKFDRLVKPFDKVELLKLKREILKTEDARIIRTWRGKHLLDRKRYELCAELNVPVKISEQYFEDWMGAAEYICREQLKGLKPGSKYQKYLIGQLLLYGVARNRAQEDTDKKTVISEIIGKEWNLSGLTVSRYGFYANALNDIFEQSEELARILLSEEVSISRDNVMEISHLRGEEIRAMAKTIKSEQITKITFSFIRNEVKLCHIQERGIVSRKEKQEQEISQNIGIRQMPKYDPDSGVNSLCMTIDSWISSINRVRDSEDFPKITEQAGMRLIKKLAKLEYTINAIQELLAERTKL